ncbi:hypothetical protein [Nonomuraea recticatena]|uniref:hypothetical protein n=1 Tax=Nonomuraea recticatena TaxID=46178 RepID=UPI0036195C32
MSTIDATNAGKRTLLRPSITPGELISAGTAVTLTAERQIHPRSAATAVRLCSASRRSGPVDGLHQTVIARDSTIEISTEGLDVGGYEIVVEQLCDAEGRILVDRQVVPFVITVLAGSIPAGSRVEHAVHLRVGELQVTRCAPATRDGEGQYIEVVKVADRETQELTILGFDEQGQQIDFRSVLDGVEQRRFAKYGRIHETLWHHMEDLPPDEQVSVIVWPPSNRSVSGLTSRATVRGKGHRRWMPKRFVNGARLKTLWLTHWKNSVRPCQSTDMSEYPSYEPG